MRKTSLSEQAYLALKQDILDQTLLPGARLNIDALCRSYGVSSSPLREALVRLEAERLVGSTANAGFIVAPVPDAEQMRQLFEFRLLIETHCARVGAAHATDAVLVALRRSVDGMVAMRERGVSYLDYQVYFGLEQNFHHAIVLSAGNQPIEATYCGLDMILYVARHSIIRGSGTLGSDEAVLEHSEILSCFEARDGPAAEAATRRHLKAAEARMAAQLRAPP